MEHLRAWITTADGTRLAVRLWLPDERPAAVILEALPYRMDDLTASYSSEYERLCKEGTFAVCRLDPKASLKDPKDYTIVGKPLPRAGSASPTWSCAENAANWPI